VLRFAAWKSKLTGEARQIPRPSYQFLWDVDCSAKSGRLVFLTGKDEKHQLWTMKADGTEQRKLLDQQTEIYSPRWSPNKDSIYYFRRQGASQDLMTLAVAAPSAQPSTLASGLQTGFILPNSTDRSRLAYTRTLSSENLWIAELSPHGAAARVHTRQLTTGTLDQLGASFSPDGRWIGLMIGSGLVGNVYKMSSSGGQPIQLTFFDRAGVAYPAWSADGRRIAFLCDQGGLLKVWIMDSDGSGAHALEKTDASGTNYELAWSPSQEILYGQPGLHSLRLLSPETQEAKTILAADSSGWFPTPRSLLMVRVWRSFGTGHRNPEYGPWHSHPHRCRGGIREAEIISLLRIVMLL
jgi:WD40 repeat protein